MEVTSVGLADRVASSGAVPDFTRKKALIRMWNIRDEC